MRKFFAVFAFLIMAATVIVNSVGIEGIKTWFNPPPEPPRPKTEVSILLDESFNTNENEWTILEEVARSYSLLNSRYELENKNSDKYYFSSIWVDSLSDKDDFTIEAKIIKRSGRNNNTFGLVWGGNEDNDRYEFGITGFGSYRISRCKDGDWEYLVNYTSNDAINQPNGSNKFTLQKRGYKLYFSINDVLMDSLAYQPLFGKKVGFGLHDSLSIAVEYLTISKP